MATKETKDDAPVDARDALEVLESEAKEWEKVRSPSQSACACDLTDTINTGCRD